MKAQVKRNQIRAILSATNGQFFTVKFVKKDGTERVMNARLGVTKHLRGGESTTAHKDNLITVFDLHKKAYRCINLDTVKQIVTNDATIDYEVA